VAWLLKTRMNLEGRKISVGVVGMRPSIRKVFDIMKVLPASQVFASVQEFDAYLAAIQRKVSEGEDG